MLLRSTLILGAVLVAGSASASIAAGAKHSEHEKSYTRAPMRAKSMAPRIESGAAATQNVKPFTRRNADDMNLAALRDKKQHRIDGRQNCLGPNRATESWPRRGNSPAILLRRTILTPVGRTGLAGSGVKYGSPKI